MSLVMRLRQGGRKNKRTFRMVITDKKARRDGKYIDCVGFYDAHAENTTVIHKEKVEKWLQQGVQLSETVMSLIKKNCPEALKVLK
jgi:small subunit ribosomal protein S16